MFLKSQRNLNINHPFIRCGDADTVGSVTGQIAGALYGLTSIPKSALECVMKWDPHAEIPLRVFKMFNIDEAFIEGLKSSSG